MESPANLRPRGGRKCEECFPETRRKLEDTEVGDQVRWRGSWSVRAEGSLSGVGLLLPYVCGGGAGARGRARESHGAAPGGEL